MNLAKGLVCCLAGAGIASAWWAFAMFNDVCIAPNDGHPLIALPITATLLFALFGTSIVAENWDND